MSYQNLTQLLAQELARLDDAKASKRSEKKITGFTSESPKQAIIEDIPRQIFNSNDYLSLRFHPSLVGAEHKASEMYGAGPGAVRFISGSLAIYHELEATIAAFHQRESAMIISSAFVANQAAIFPILKPQVKGSLLDDQVLVVSDELNHRSIIDAVRLAGLGSVGKAIFPHFDLKALETILQESVDKFSRVIVVTDGIFSMLGEYQDLLALRNLVDKYDSKYPQGVIMVVDDAHGVGAFGKTGRGTEEVTGGQAHILTGTFGKAFGADGGYIVGDKVYIDYLRETAAPYIYSNPFSPATAAAAKAAVELVDSQEGRELLSKLAHNIARFKQGLLDAGLKLAADSKHAIQPLLIGDTQKAKAITAELFKRGVLATTISYPVVPVGRDEIRLQLSATHTDEVIDQVVAIIKETCKDLL